MIDLIALWIGKIILFIGGGLLLLALLGLLAYLVYNQWLIRILDWKNTKSREVFYYYLQNKEEINKYIESKNRSD